MPKETWLWVLVVVLIVCLAGLAVWKNAAIDLLFGPKGVVFKTRPAKIESARSGQASDVNKVAEGAKIDGNVGKIIGQQGAAGTTSASHTEVAKGLVAGKGSNIGEIVGTKIEGPRGDG